ncbi:MAG: hypothetical protein E7177_04215 [Erysipelotrichaceae bacterium]|nr:hypothetical protein [Erysipelotrichaceae bacterium]
MIDYESKISKVLAIIKYVVTLPAIVFIILFWVKNNELFLTLVFVCTSLFFLLNALACLLEIKHCARKEEKTALKIFGFTSLAGFIIFLLVVLYRI